MKRGLVAFLLAVAACGGGETPPGPLRYTIDDYHLASVQVTEKQPVIDAKQDFDVAQMEHAKAQSDMDELQVKVEVAKNDIDKAVLDEKSAQTQKRVAAKSADMTKRNNAERELLVATLGRKAADAKMGYLKEEREHMKQVLRYTLRNMYAKESKWQQAKAHVAQAKNIRPPGFDLKNFDGQARDRSDEAQRAKSKTDGSMRKAEGKRKDWEKREAEFNTARGLNTQPPEPTPSSVVPPSASQPTETK
jgi:hypothetical protein